MTFVSCFTIEFRYLIRSKIRTKCSMLWTETNFCIDLFRKFQCLSRQMKNYRTRLYFLISRNNCSYIYELCELTWCFVMLIYRVWRFSFSISLIRKSERYTHTREKELKYNKSRHSNVSFEIAFYLRQSDKTTTIPYNISNRKKNCLKCQILNEYKWVQNDEFYDAMNIYSFLPRT